MNVCGSVLVGDVPNNALTLNVSGVTVPTVKYWSSAGSPSLG